MGELQTQHEADAKAMAAADANGKANGKANAKAKVRRRLAVQLTLARTGGIGGRRKGAGRKVAPGKRRAVPHRKRPRLDGKNHPVHVTVRVKRAAGVPSLRCELVRRLLREIIDEKNDIPFGIDHHSLQYDHLHLIAEAMDARALARGMGSFLIRFAKRLNELLGRTGAVFSGRYHRHDLRTPTEVAHALVYVLHNGKKHGEAPPHVSWLDPFSSAAEFDGWIDIEIDTIAGGATRGPPPRRPRTWLLRVGYRRARVELKTTSAPKPKSMVRAG